MSCGLECLETHPVGHINKYYSKNTTLIKQLKYPRSKFTLKHLEHISCVMKEGLPFRKMLCSECLCFNSCVFYMKIFTWGLTVGVLALDVSSGNPAVLLRLEELL